MVRALQLLFPVLVPSWRFFPEVSASPRIDVAVICDEDSASPIWQEFRPAPAKLSLLQSVRRLFWNPSRNEALFLVTCAERYGDDGDTTWLKFVETIVRNELRHQHDNVGQPTGFKFRIVALSRNGTEIVREQIYVSPVHLLSEECAA